MMQKKRRKLPFEKVYINALPVSARYSKSLMHKDQLSFDGNAGPKSSSEESSPSNRRESVSITFRSRERSGSTMADSGELAQAPVSKRRHSAVEAENSESPAS
jgi:hypothetical protein